MAGSTLGELGGGTMCFLQVEAHHAVSTDWIGGYQVQTSSELGLQRVCPRWGHRASSLLYQWLKTSWLVALLEALAHRLLVSLHLRLWWYLAKRRDHWIAQVSEESRLDWMPAHQPGVSQGEGVSRGVRDQGNNQLGGGGGGFCSA